VRWPKIATLILLTPAFLGSVLATEAAAASTGIVSLQTLPHSVGRYHLDLVASREEGFGRALLQVRFAEHRRRADQTHTFSFDLPSRVLAVTDDLGAGSLRTGELATQGQPSDYGSVDMQFAATGPAHTVSAPCRGGAQATLTTRDGELTGALDFDSGTVALGAVDLGRLAATASALTVPRGCGPKAVLLLLGGASIPVASLLTCVPGLFLFAFDLLPDGSHVVLIAEKVRLSGQTFTALTLDILDPSEETAPASVDHSISVIGPEGMFAASPGIESARIRGAPGRPFLSGSLRFTALGHPKKHHTKKCDETLALGRVGGRLVAHLDVVGTTAVTSMSPAFLSRDRPRSGPSSRAAFAATWRAPAASL